MCASELSKRSGHAVTRDTIRNLIERRTSAPPQTLVPTILSYVAEAERQIERDQEGSPKPAASSKPHVARSVRSQEARALAAERDGLRREVNTERTARIAAESEVRALKADLKQARRTIAGLLRTIADAQLP